MLESKLIEKFAKTPGLMSEIDRTIHHPVTHAYGPIQDEYIQLRRNLRSYINHFK